MSMEKLLHISSEPFCRPQVLEAETGLFPEGRLGRELQDVYKKKNGFFAFETCLRFFPLADSVFGLSVHKWNDKSCWKQHYGAYADDCFCFAEDVFCNQFCIAGDDIEIFDIETARCKPIARFFEEWAKILLSDYKSLTGHHVWKDWFDAHGGLAPLNRLFPKIPFVAGGPYAVQNLFEDDPLSVLSIFGQIAVQIHNLPDGKKIKIKIRD